MALVNNLSVFKTKSPAALQTCTVGLEKEVRIFSYKCCEGEHDPLGKGDDYAFSFTYGNMGECSGTTTVTECLSVTDIGGVQLKIMDVCPPCGNYDIYVFGCIFDPYSQQYFCLNHLYSIEFLQSFGVELVVCPGVDLCFYVLDENYNFYLTLPPHSINTAAALFQVEEIFCDSCPCPCGGGLKTMDVDNIKVGTKEDLEALLKLNNNIVEEDVDSSNTLTQKNKDSMTRRR